MTARQQVGSAEMSAAGRRSELATSSEPSDTDAPVGRGRGCRFEAPAVLRMLWADPQYMPEHLALWSLKRFGHKGLLSGREAAQLAS